MAISNRYRILMALSTLMLGACSSDATDPIALSPESVSTSSESVVLLQEETPESFTGADSEGLVSDARPQCCRNTLIGTDADDVINGSSGNDTIDGRGGSDQIATGSGRDSVVYSSVQRGSAPDQLSDWETRRDRFRLDAADFGVVGDLSFVNALAADLPSGGVNVIVLQNTDNDGVANTSFNARAAAQLIGAEITEAGPGFFIYFNEGLQVNRLVFSEDLSNGDAAISVLSAINTLVGQVAINALTQFRANNFRFTNENDIIGGSGGDDTVIGTDADDVINGFSGNDTIDGRGGSDQIATGSGRDSVVYSSVQRGSAPDQLSDWETRRDRFLLDAADFGVVGDLSFVNALAADLPSGGVNVIVLQNADNDGVANTSFNARAAAQLIGAEITEAGPGFFIYFNEGLQVNRLVFSEDLSNGDAAISVLSAINTLVGQEAIDELPEFSEANFAFL